VLVGSVATVMVSTILIALTDAEVDFIQILFEVVSALPPLAFDWDHGKCISISAKLV